MVKKENPKEKLLNYLDENVFDPVINAPETNYAESDLDDLKYVKEAKQSEKERYHKEYPTAEDIKKQFQLDLSSGAAQDVEERLQKLDLPTFADVKDEFMDLCNRLGI